MQVFLFSASIDSARLNDLEHRIRAKIPDVRIVDRMEEVTKALPKTVGNDRELACILFPVVLNAPASFDRMVSIAAEYRASLFFIFISDDIPPSDSNPLVHTVGPATASPPPTPT